MSIFTNGVPISLSGRNTPLEPNRRSFSIPDISDKQAVFNHGNTSYSSITKTISFIPDKNYECLWVYSKDENSFPFGEINEALFKINYLTCDVDPTKTVTSTYSKFDYGSSVGSFHIALPSLLTASGKINIIPRPLVDVLTNTRVGSQGYDDKISFTAGKSITIKPDNTLSKSLFHAKLGSVFSAKISNTLGCQDACETFTPWHADGVGPNYYTGKDKGDYNIRWLLLVNQCGSTRPNNEWRVISNYPKPYNAYRAELIIFGGPFNATRDRPYFTQVWEDPLKRGLPEGCVVWKPTSSTPAGVYVAYLKLTNCNGDYVLTDSRDRWPDVTVGCGGNIVGTGEEQFDSQNSNNGLLDNNTINNLQKAYTNTSYNVGIKSNPSVTVAPNPTTGIIKILSNAHIGKSVIKITNILGMEQMSFNVDDLSENNIMEYNIASFPAGMYLISVISGNKVISRTKINKL